MCPACLAAAALIAGSSGTTAGIAVLALKKFCGKKAANQVRTRTMKKENRNAQWENECTETTDRVTRRMDQSSQAALG
jgi:hypothetical protein